MSISSFFWDFLAFSRFQKILLACGTEQREPVNFLQIWLEVLKRKFIERMLYKICRKKYDGIFCEICWSFGWKLKHFFLQTFPSHSRRNIFFSCLAELFSFFLFYFQFVETLTKNLKLMSTCSMSSLYTFMSELY